MNAKAYCDSKGWTVGTVLKTPLGVGMIVEIDDYAAHGWDDVMVKIFAGPNAAHGQNTGTMGFNLGNRCGQDLLDCEEFILPSIRVGQKVQFKKGNEVVYGQDFGWCEGIDHTVEFWVYAIMQSHSPQIETRIELKAPGYGGKPYGNGAIFVKESDVLPNIVDESEKKPVQYVYPYPEVLAGNHSVRCPVCHSFKGKDECKRCKRKEDSKLLINILRRGDDPDDPYNTKRSIGVTASEVLPAKRS